MQRALASEAIGTFFLLACVVGSGIMAERLAGGNMAVALLGNTIATGAMLYVLITILGPISGAHFNPAVTLALWLEKILVQDHQLIIFFVLPLLRLGLLLRRRLGRLILFHMDDNCSPPTIDLLS